MNPFNKIELIGIFGSVAVMALALSFIRFETDTLTKNTVSPESQQGAVIAVSQSNGDSETELEAALRTASSEDGTLSKLVVDDVRVGSGDPVTEGDIVTVHYIGTTQDGVRFDSSYERGEPFVFTVGEKKVIEGWEKGLIGMKVGGQRILVIPSEMAYGNRQIGPIKPNATLVFSVELLKIE